MAENRHPSVVPKRFVQAFKGLVKRCRGVRSVERIYDINKATVSRLQRGSEPDMDTGRFVGKLVGVCPCCGGDWPTTPSP